MFKSLTGEDLVECRKLLSESDFLKKCGETCSQHNVDAKTECFKTLLRNSTTLMTHDGEL